MRLARGIDEFRPPAGRAVVATIGNFDGVHRGHQRIMARVAERAGALGGLPLVVTFEPHPLRILAPDRAPRLLMTREQKLAALEAAGIEAVVILPFDRDLATMPAEVFARDLLGGRLGVRELYIGPDFRFGRGRAGDLELLRRIGRAVGFSADAVPPVMDGGERISASRIRRLLSEGRASEAARLLGRPFALVGTVVHGEGRGRPLLVPTANLAPENEFLPARGVYVTQAAWAGREAFGLTNVGTRPTFGDRRLVVETFLPGLDEDLYGRRLELRFLDRLRDERRFDTAADLRRQIESDLESFEAWRRGRG
ncbi:MAG: riboflavin biosynthesis protein RibF [Acidobacteria bacterium]|nr:MAG: riboflavin biosynthesis protein RibF [Acidobacteriota bacterium]